MVIQHCPMDSFLFLSRPPVRCQWMSLMKENHPVDSKPRIVYFVVGLNLERNVAERFPAFPFAPARLGHVEWRQTILSPSLNQIWKIFAFVALRKRLNVGICSCVSTSRVLGILRFKRYDLRFSSPFAVKLLIISLQKPACPFLLGQHPPRLLCQPVPQAERDVCLVD